MKNWLLIGIVVLLVIWGLSVESRIFDCRETSEWNRWVNWVSLAAQGGNNERSVEEMLGKPAVVKKLNQLSYPKKVRIPHRTSFVYLYKPSSWRDRGAWRAYIFFDSGGATVGYRIFSVSDSY